MNQNTATDRKPNHTVLRDVQAGFIGDPRSPDGVYCVIRHNGDEVIGRLESHFSVQAPAVVRVEGRWNKRCEYFILKPAKGEDRIKKTRYHIIADHTELKPLAHIKDEDGRIAYRWLRTGQLVFPAFDIRSDIREYEGQPLILVGNHTVALQVTGEQALASFLASLDDATPFDSTIVRRGTVQWIPLDERTFQAGHFDGDGGYVGRYEELSPWGILGLDARPKTEVEVIRAYEARVDWLNTKFSEAALEPFRISLGEERYRGVLRVVSHNQRKLDVALGLGRIVVKQENALTTAAAVGASRLMERFKALPGGQPRPQRPAARTPQPKALVAKIGEVPEDGITLLTEILNEWATCLRAALLEPNRETVTVNDIEAWASALQSVTLAEPKALEGDDKVVLSLFARAELPEQHHQELLRYIRVQLQEADPNDYPAPGTAVNAIVPSLTGPIIEGAAAEEWAELFTDGGIGERRNRLKMGQAFAHHFGNRGPATVRREMKDADILATAERAYAAMSLSFGTPTQSKLLAKLSKYA